MHGPPDDAPALDEEQLAAAQAAACGAIASGQPDQLRLQLELGVDARGLVDPYGVPGLVVACCMGQPECATLLLERMADPNGAVGSRSSSPLAIACHKRQPACVKLLLEAKADFTAPCNDKTPLEIARERGCAECEALLEDARYQKKLRDSSEAARLLLASEEEAAAAAAEAAARSAAPSGRRRKGKGKQRAAASASTSASASADEVPTTVSGERASAGETQDVALFDARHVADRRLGAAMRAAVADCATRGLRAEIEACAAHASASVLAEARLTRDRLKRRERKLAARAQLDTGAAETSPEISSLAPPPSSAPLPLEPPPPSSAAASSSAAEPTAEPTAAPDAPVEPPLAAIPAAADVPEQFLCPITLQIMRDPVITADGHAYERAAIEKWLEKSAASPQTGLALPHRMLTPSIALKQLIVEFQEKARL